LYPTVFQFLNKFPDLKTLNIVLYSAIQSHAQAIASTSFATLILSICGDWNYMTFDLGWLILMLPSLGDLQIDYSGAMLYPKVCSSILIQ
jgi:hypothetical protein